MCTSPHAQAHTPTIMCVTYSPGDAHTLHRARRCVCARPVASCWLSQRRPREQRVRGPFNNMGQRDRMRKMTREREEVLPHQRYIPVSGAEHFQHHLHLLWCAVVPQIVLILTCHLQHTCIDVSPGSQTQVLSLKARTTKSAFEIPAEANQRSHKANVKMCIRIDKGYINSLTQAGKCSTVSCVVPHE